MENMEIKQKPKVTIYMLAYNSEKYLKETIESVLSQTEKSFEFILCNNGSTDKTGEICRYYASKDSRIVFFENKKNRITDDGIKFPERGFFPKFNGKYISMMDSDDLLHPKFLEILLEKAEKYDADIAVAGSYFFDDGTDPYKSNVGRPSPNCVITNDNDLGKYFSDLYQCFRPVWGKLFKTDFYEKYYDYAWSKPEWLINGMDTYCCLAYLEKVKCIVCVDECLHYYRMRKESIFYTMDISNVNRIRTGKVLFDRAIKCLDAHNIRTKKNVQYLYSVLIGHMWDLLNLVIKSDASVKDKLFYLDYMFNKEESLDKTVFIYGWNLIKENTLKILKSCCSSEQSTSLDWTNYLIRFYSAINELKGGTYLQFLAFYSALCDRENKNHFGVSELNYKTPYNEREKLFIALPMDKKLQVLNSVDTVIQWFTNSAQLDLFEQHKEMLFKYMDEQNLEKAFEVILNMTQISPLDRVVLYFRALMLWQIGEHEIAFKIAQCAKGFYSEDEDINCLYNDMFNLMCGNKE